MKYNYNDFLPVDGQVLVEQVKPHQVSTTNRRRTDEAMAREAKHYAEIETDEEGKPIPKPEFVYEDGDFIDEKVKVDAAYRIGKVLVAAEDNPFKAGTYIVYREGAQMPMDLLTTKVGDTKCPVFIRRFDIKAVLTEQAVNKL